ncbi:hypothetical protein TNIN_67111 [Trichonephila inaurata madagascariensis]|uniref:Uncharacterized protein n=1 Tax=Trichonephila inaurata madagascariensis TaxID=2747483 RepID=A0A8X6WL62_9ARAC|nr:hypothetical protein TNIN_67111 [Trichonephila inaurata madagascariensis]
MHSQRWTFLGPTQFSLLVAPLQGAAEEDGCASPAPGVQGTIYGSFSVEQGQTPIEIQSTYGEKYITLKKAWLTDLSL